VEKKRLDRSGVLTWENGWLTQKVRESKIPRNKTEGLIQWVKNPRGQVKDRPQRGGGDEKPRLRPAFYEIRRAEKKTRAERGERGRQNDYLKNNGGKGGEKKNKSWKGGQP